MNTFKTKWKSIFGLLLIVMAFVLNLPWMFGVFFFIWAINDIKNGETYILGGIKKTETPILYWITILIWFILALYYIDVIKEYVDYGIWFTGDSLHLYG